MEGNGTMGVAHRFTSAGTVDSAFGTDGVMAVDEIGGALTYYPFGLGLQPSGELLVGLGVAVPGPVWALPAAVRMNDDMVHVDRVPGAFASLAPARILDTRTGNGAPVAKVPANGVLDLQVVGRGGVPAAAASAVVLNVTVTEPGAAGFVTVFPTGTTAPLASNLNFVGGQTIANLVTVKLGTDGKVSFKNGSPQPVHLVADIAGFYAGGEVTEPGAFASLVPDRLLDTRVGTGVAAPGPVASQASVPLQVNGRGGVPSDGVAAIVLNVTVTGPTGAGFVTAYPNGTVAPLASNLNFVAGQTIPNMVTVKVGSDGKVLLRNGSGGSLDLVADVAGYYLAGEATQPGTFVPLDPARLFDTRDRVYAPWGVGSFESVYSAVAGEGGVPTTGVAAAVLNVTAVNALSSGYLTVYPAAVFPPLASNVNFGNWQTIPNQVIVKVADGVAFLNGSPSGVHIVADVAGYFRI
jgi:hypothetical protein